MDTRGNDIFVIDLDTSPRNNSSTAEKFHACERDMETIFAKIAQSQPMLSRFDEEDDVRHRREQQAGFIGYLSMFLTLSSLVLWITATSLSDSDAKNIVDKCQTAVMIIGLLSYGAYIYRKTPPDGWPIKLRTLTCSLSSDDIQPLNELLAALLNFKRNIAVAYSEPEIPEYKIAKLIDGNIQSVIGVLEDNSVTINKVKQNFDHIGSVIGAAQVLFQKTAGYEPRKNAGHALTLFAPVHASRVAAAGSEKAPLLGLK